MLQELKSLLFDDIGAPAGDRDPAEREQRVRVAAAVLLVEVMRADPQVEPVEREAVLAALRRDFSLAPDALDRLLAVAQQSSRTANDFFQFTTVLNEAFDRDQRIRLVEDMWRVALADGHLGTQENSVISRVADLLHLTHGEYIAAKVRIQDALGLPR